MDDDNESEGFEEESYNDEGSYSGDSFSEGGVSGDSDTFTETTTQGWGSRLGKSLKNVIGGMALFFAAFGVLFYNEGRSVKRYETLKEGSSSVISIGHEEIVPGNNGKLVHFSGNPKYDEKLLDNSFGYSASALKLKRNVSMYQWEQEKREKKVKKTGGSEKTVTTYHYNRVWRDKLISSSSFRKKRGHRNPSSMPIQSKEFRAKNTKVGAFKISDSIIKKIDEGQKMEVNQLPKALPGGFENSKVKLDGGGLYYGNGIPSTPRIGDIKISYEVVKPEILSIVSQQQNGLLQPYRTSNAGTIELVQTGGHGAQAMFDKAQSDNAMLTWGMRLLGFAMMFFGLAMALKPISVVLDVLPILGNIAEMGTNLVAFVIAAICSITTIAIAWLFYRPILAIGLLGLVGGLVYFFAVKKKKSSLSSSEAKASVNKAA